jgi:hypothetical protein
VDELDATIRTVRQRIQNLAVENEGAMHSGMPAQGLVERSVVEMAQIAAEPHQGGFCS